MATIDQNPIDIDCTYTLPDYSADEYNDFLEKLFSFEDPLQLPFYDTPQGAIFRKIYSPKIQIKRRILEYRAKY